VRPSPMIPEPASLSPDEYVAQVIERYRLERGWDAVQVFQAKLAVEGLHRRAEHVFGILFEVDDSRLTPVFHEVILLGFLTSRIHECLRDI